MVQVINLGPSRGQLQAEILGQGAQQLGQGLGEFMGNYFAGKALDDLSNDPSLKDAPLSERWQAAQSRMAKYGERGQKLLQQRVMMEQQAQKEKSQKQESKLVQKLLRGEEISDEELEGTRPELQIMAHKARQPKSPPGGVTAQPVPEQVNKAIASVLSNSKGLNADQLKLAMDQAQIPPIYSNGYVESRRQETKPTFEPESEKLEAKRVANLSTAVEKDYITAKNENIRLERMEELSGKENLSTPLMIKALDTIGLPIGILSNPDTEEYRKLETDFIRDARDVFPGGRITNYEIQSYLKTIPTLLNSKEGREAIIRNRKLFNEAKEIKYNEYKNILKENSGKKPPNLGILLEERTADKISDIEDKFKQGIQKETEKFQQSIPMLDPQGRPVNIPPNQIERALKSGAKFR